MHEIKRIIRDHPIDTKICLVLVSIFHIITIYIDNFAYTRNWFETISNIINIVTLFIIIFVPYWFAKKATIEKATYGFGSYWLLGLKINLTLFFLYFFWEIVSYLVRIVFLGWEAAFIYGIWIFVTPILGAIIMLFIGGISASFAGLRNRTSKN